MTRRPNLVVRRYLERGILHKGRAKLHSRASIHDVSWLEKTEDELLLELGKRPGQRQALPLSPAQLRRNAEHWLDENLPKILDRVCSEPETKRFEQEKELLFHAIAEIVVHFSLHVPAGCVAAYIVNRGVTRLCKTRWAVSMLDAVEKPTD